jgi:hypothetical protein
VNVDALYADPVLDQAPQEVVFLGAGFSRAVSDQFPLTDELGELAVARAETDGHGPIPHPVFRDGNFEMWLSRLVEEQPYLDAASNLENQSRFRRLSQAIRSVLVDRQDAVLGAGPKDWLYDLLSVLHARHATVVTLNYDNLVECAAESHYLNDWGAQQRVSTEDVLYDIPPSAERPVGMRKYLLASTFRLLKLHGSLSWYWSPDDTTGMTLQRWKAPGTFGAPVPDNEDQRRRALPGREPFIVPPSAAKSAFYANLVTRELWSQAFSALRHAKRIVLIGYSLPIGDLTVGGMIGDAAANRDVSFEIINPNPDPVCERLTILGVDRNQITRIQDGYDCVEHFTRRYLDEQARELVDRLRAWPGSLSTRNLEVSWGGQTERRVAHLDNPDPTTNDLLIDPSVGSELAPCLDLGALLARFPDTKRLVTVAADGRHLPIVDTWIGKIQPGETDPPWISLIPSGRPAS